MRTLLLGCGESRDKRMRTPGSIQAKEPFAWQGELITADCYPTCNPDVLINLNEDVWPWYDEFDEVHAYHVLEHLGQQGDYRAFFRTFTCIWHALKDGGYLCAMVPQPASAWAWGDPGHTRIISKESLSFLAQSNYSANVGKTPMADYRRWYPADFRLLHSEYRGDDHVFIIQAIKKGK